MLWNQFDKLSFILSRHMNYNNDFITNKLIMHYNYSNVIEHNISITMCDKTRSYLVCISDIILTLSSSIFHFNLVMNWPTQIDLLHKHYFRLSTGPKVHTSYVQPPFFNTHSYDYKHATNHMLYSSICQYKFITNNLNGMLTHWANS